MNKPLSLALVLFILTAACSATVTGSTSNPVPETDADTQVDAASADAGNIVRPDANATETAVADSAQPDVATRDAPVTAEDAGSDASQPDAVEDTAVDADVANADDGSISDVPSADVSTDASGADAPVVSSFEIEPYEMRPSLNLVPVPGNRALFASFRGRSRGENATMQRLRIPIHGLSASVQDVMVSSREGESVVRYHGVAIPSTGTDPHVDVHFMVPMRFVRDEWKVFWIGGMLSPIQARSSVAPGTPAAFSGAHIQMGLEAGETSGSWDASYASSFNAEVVGDDSRAHLYAPGRTTYGNYMVVRRSRPRISIIPPVSDDLIHVGTPNVLYDWEIEAEAIGGSLSWRKMTYTVETDGDINLSEFQLVRDGRAVPLDRYEIVDGTNRNMRGLLRVSGTFYITIRWHDEEVIESGVRHTYRLIAVARGGRTGNAIRTTPLRSGHALPGTGWMTADTYGLTIGGRDVAGPSFIEMIMSTGSTATVPAAFLWSDLSEVPHVARPYPMGSSDWTDDGLVDDLVPTYVRYAP